MQCAGESVVITGSKYPIVCPDRYISNYNYPLVYRGKGNSRKPLYQDHTYMLACKLSTLPRLQIYAAERFDQWEHLVEYYSCN